MYYYCFSVVLVFFCLRQNLIYSVWESNLALIPVGKRLQLSYIPSLLSPVPGFYMGTGNLNSVFMLVWQAL